MHRTLLGAAACALALPLAAQADPCEPSDTVAQCITRLEGRTPRNAEAAAAARVETRVQSRSTGLPVGPAASSISDFLPLFAGMLGGTTDDAAGALAIDYNLRLDFDPADPGAQVIRARVIRHKAELYGPLIQAIPEMVRAERVAALSEGLGDFDDVEVRLAWNLETGAFGRNFGQYRRTAGTLFSAITAAAERAATADPAARATAVSRMLNDLDDDAFEAGCDPDDAGDPATLMLRCLKPGPRGRLVAELRRVVLSEARLDSIVRQALTDGGFFRFADLVNNQPQLNVEAHGRFRVDRAGPASWGGTIRFELGFANVNRFRRYCRTAGHAVEARCLAEYLALPGVARALGRGDRLWFALDYERTDDWAFAIPVDSVDLAITGPWAVTVSAGFGRYLGSAADQLEQGRIDLQGEYVFRKDDVVRENRGVVNLTYTQRVSDNTSVVLGLSWASKPEFLGQVDEKLSATFGIRYGLARGSPTP